MRSTVWRIAPLAAALGIAAATGAARAKVPERPPDPRRGERLDGRAPPPSPPPRYARAVPRLILAVPRVALKAVSVPVLYASEKIEEGDWMGRILRLTTTGDGLRGVRPIIGFESAFGLGFGVRAFDRRTMGRGSLLEVRGDTTIGKSYGAELRVRPIEERFGFMGRVETTNSLQFAGIHGETREELQARGLDVARYSQDRYTGMADVRFELARWVAAEVHAGADMKNFGDGKGTRTDPPISEVYCSPDCAMGTVNETEVPGFEDGTRRAVAGTRIVLDSRRSRWATGAALRLDGDWAHGLGRDDSHDFTTVADGRLQLGVGNRAISLRGKAGLVEPLGDAPVPFSELLRLGGDEGVRGLTSQKWRGHSMLLGSLEYRFLLTSYNDAVLFVDYGGAFDERFDGISRDRMRPSVGVGLRNYRSSLSPRYWEAPVQAGVDIAWSPDEGWRLAFSTLL